MKKRFESVSLEEVDRLYTPADIANVDFSRDISFPGRVSLHAWNSSNRLSRKNLDHAPVCRVQHARRNQRSLRYLLEQGQTGLSVAYDLPTLMGYDADSPLSEGEVGKCGVAVSSLADMEVLFDKIPLEQVTVSQTINAPASVLLAMYLVVAEKQGADWKKISGHTPERYSQGIHRSEGMDLSDPAGDEAGGRHV